MEDKIIEYIDRSLSNLKKEEEQITKAIQELNGKYGTSVKEEKTEYQRDLVKIHEEMKRREEERAMYHWASNVEEQEKHLEDLEKQLKEKEKEIVAKREEMKKVAQRILNPLKRDEEQIKKEIEILKERYGAAAKEELARYQEDLEKVQTEKKEKEENLEKYISKYIPVSDIEELQKGREAIKKEIEQNKTEIEEKRKLINILYKKAEKVKEEVKSEEEEEQIPHEEEEVEPEEEEEQIPHEEEEVVPEEEEEQIPHEEEEVVLEEEEEQILYDEEEEIIRKEIIGHMESVIQKINNILREEHTYTGVEYAKAYKERKYMSTEDIEKLFELGKEIPKIVAELTKRRNELKDLKKNLVEENLEEFQKKYSETFVIETQECMKSCEEKMNEVNKLYKKTIKAMDEAKKEEELREKLEEKANEYAREGTAESNEQTFESQGFYYYERKDNDLELEPVKKGKKLKKISKKISKKAKAVGKFLIKKVKNIKKSKAFKGIYNLLDKLADRIMPLPEAEEVYEENELRNQIENGDDEYESESTSKNEKVISNSSFRKKAKEYRKKQQVPQSELKSKKSNKEESEQNNDAQKGPERDD